MDSENAFERRKAAAVRVFQRDFFEKFGIYAEVQLKEPEYTLNILSDTDRELQIIKQVLNSRIPVYLSKKYNSISCRIRKREIVELRMIFMKLAREKGLKLKEIARECNISDHSTVIYGCETVHNLLQTDPSFLERYNSILHEIQEKIIQENARINQSAEQEQNNSQSASVITLYPGKGTSRYSASIGSCRGTDMSEAGMDRYRTSSAAKSFAVVK